MVLQIYRMPDGEHSHAFELQTYEKMLRLIYTIPCLLHRTDLFISPVITSPFIWPPVFSPHHLSVWTDSEFAAVIALDAQPVGSNIIIRFASPEMWWRVYSRLLLVLMMMFAQGLVRNNC
jgi:hypothetical protein